MEQCTTTSTEQNSFFMSATEDELIVSQILLDLGKMLKMSEPHSKSVWGCKRRRSCLDVAPSLSSAPTSKVESTEDEIEVRRPQVKAAEERPTAVSPTTPLSFSPSECDEKAKRCSKKNSREEFMDMIERFTQQGDLVRREIQNARKYFYKLKACHSELKAMKQEIMKPKQSNFL